MIDISVTNLVKEFEVGSKILDGLTFQVDSGERVGLLGPNGCGKTTLLRILTGVMDYDEGEVVIAPGKRVGLISQIPVYPAGYTVEDVLDDAFANLHAMERGMEVLRAVDFYDPEGREVEIRLDPLLVPQQNAAKYYKDYNKAKTAEQMLTIQLEKGTRELEYLNSVLENLSLAEGERDLQEIRQELVETGYLRRGKTAAKRQKRVSGKPMEFRSSAGLRISVGKNNSQNDQLTTKLAYKSDIWLHTQKIHGSHVILWLEGGEAAAQSLTEAAILAATFSQAGEGSRVPVDYTPVKYVKKPAGARPGMVVYTTYQTAVVDPDPELAKRLRVK